MNAGDIVAIGWQLAIVAGFAVIIGRAVRRQRRSDR